MDIQNNWLHTKALFWDDENNVTGSEERLQVPFSLDLNKIESYNEYEKDKYTTVRFNSGFDIVITIELEMFRAIMETYVSK